jgi:hypothetical protein
MSLPGAWVLHYSWGATSTYAQTTLTLKNDGTFSGAGNGKWRIRDGTLLLSFDGGPAKYGGTIDGSVGSGAMSTFAGLNGTWYLTRQGTVGVAGEAAASRTHDAAGNVL